MIISFQRALKRSVKLRRFTLFAFSLILPIFSLSCATRSPHPDLQLIPEPQYFRLIDQNTRRTERYEGLMNTLNSAATLLTSEVKLAQVDQRARLMLTPTEQYQQEKFEAHSELEKELHIHLSLFVPESRFNNLHNSKSNWSIFLDTSAGRIQPRKIHRLKWNFAEARRVYPHHTRWHTSYLLIFPVPTSRVEKDLLKLTLTGPIAQAQFNWP
jgi:hypothetical protein